MFGVFVVFIETNAFSQQICIKLIKSDKVWLQRGRKNPVNFQNGKLSWGILKILEFMGIENLG